jgi:hypothetical protein
LKPDNIKWKARVLLFSGRQNPEWQLTAMQQKNWMLLWKHASLSDTKAEPPSKLGYTGCRLQYDEHSHWYLYNGCVSFYENETFFSKNDEGRQMELFLLNTAPAEVKAILTEQNII